MPGGMNPHYWVVLNATAKGIVMVSLTSPKGHRFAHRAQQADFPSCLRYDSDVFWKGLGVFAPDTLNRMRPCGMAAEGAIGRLVAEGRRRGLIPHDIDSKLPLIF